MSEHEDDDDARQRDIAGQMQRAHPGWMVASGSYSRMFWAFPPFGPRGGYFAAPARHRHTANGQQEQPR